MFVCIDAAGECLQTIKCYATAVVMSSAAGLKQLGVSPAHWHHIQHLSCLRGLSGASLAHKQAHSRSAVAAQAAPHDQASDQGLVNSSLDTSAEAPVAAYVHLPFCKRKCFYCDFPVEAVGLNVNKTKTQDKMTAYVDLVCAEIRATTRLGQQPLQTVSFGGGTPSLIPPHLLERILTTLQQQFSISPQAEISLEADPGTFDLDRLQQYKALGVSRLSMGVQCFNQELLQTCGRSHSLEDVYAAMEAVKAADFPSWSLDLISGLPKLTLEVWQHSLNEAIAADPDHISIYDLQVEHGTPFERWYAGKDSLLPQEPEAVAMFEAASASLTAAGYEHYEISNYAKPGHRSRHNQVYWNCQPYYAFGLGAASYARGRRFTRPRVMKEYEEWVQGYVASGAGCPAAQLPPESQEDRLLDLVMLQLRLSDGLDLRSVRQQFGQDALNQLLPTVSLLMQRSLMQLADRQALHAQLAQAQETVSAQDSTVSHSSSKNGEESARGPQDVSVGALLAGVTVRGMQDSAREAEVQVLRQLLKEGWPSRVRLTDPDGFLLSNDVIAELFAALAEVA